MAIDRRGWLPLVALTLWPGVAAAQLPALGPAVERVASKATGVAAADERAAMARFGAYAMLRLSFQAANPRLEWEMNLRKRPVLWADGTLRVLRLSWYSDPAGQPPGLYAAFDFRGDRADGTMDCGYVVVHRAVPDAAWTVVRTDTSEVPPELMLPPALGK